MSEEEAEAGPKGAGADLPGPRDNTLLFGQEAAEAVLLSAYRSGRLPHAWLLSGPRGIGKATLAFRFARFLLAQGEGGGLFAPPAETLALDPGHPVFRRVVSGGHADLLVVERGFDPRRRRRRSEIVVEDTRGIAAFLRLTPGEGGWRIVILDEADAMNRNAANAVLKILEEPPQRALLLLLSEAPGRLLPTIRSRCRRLVLKPLAEPVVAAALARYRPDLAAGDRAGLARLAQGSIGRALDLASSGGLELYRMMIKILSALPKLDYEVVHELADRLARSEAEASYALLTELLPGWLAEMVRSASGGGAADIPPGEAETMRRLAGRRSLDQWVGVWENVTHLFNEADGINLDRKQVVLNAFFSLEAAAR